MRLPSWALLPAPNWRSSSEFTSHCLNAIQRANIGNQPTKEWRPTQIHRHQQWARNHQNNGLAQTHSETEFRITAGQMALFLKYRGQAWRLPSIHTRSEKKMKGKERIGARNAQKAFSWG
jgi:hypothetical protein